MSHREHCMSGAFSRILGHFGLIKAPQPAAKLSESQYPHPSEVHLSEVEACNLQSPSSNRKPGEDTHMGVFNGALNKGVSPINKAPDKKALGGFRKSVTVSVCCEPCTPVVAECTSGSGGVQGLQWFSEKMMVDEDGDVAQEFLDEVINSQISGPQVGYTRFLSNSKLKLKTRPAKLTGPVCTCDGNVVQTVEPFMKQMS